MKSECPKFTKIKSECHKFPKKMPAHAYCACFSNSKSTEDIDF